jgi:hypothetical protein
VEPSERLGRHGWVVECSLTWLLGLRRVGVRYERQADLLQVRLRLACVLIWLRFVSMSEGGWVPG